MVFHTLFITSPSKIVTVVAGKVALNIIFEVAQLLLKSLPSHQDKNAQTIPNLWPKWPNSIPYLSCQNGWKTVPFEAAHTYIAHIRKYPFRALISKPKKPVRVSSLCTAAPPLNWKKWERDEWDSREGNTSGSGSPHDLQFVEQTISQSKDQSSFIYSLLHSSNYVAENGLKTNFHLLNPVDPCSAEGSSCAAGAWTELSNFLRNFFVAAWFPPRAERCILLNTYFLDFLMH